MHVSLDSALGRQRRLNSVGESITQIAPDPAAAYSLRSLTGGDPTVVRVRRGSDNHEQDFTASEVSAGALTSFVNAQVVAPLDIQALEANGRTGDFLIAKAAYSLRSLGTRQATLAATGDTVARADGKFVAQVRRNVNGDVKSFTADEVTDGTLTSFVNESFTSSLPLDVAGSAAAAYGLRNLSSSYSGNVVEVRRSSDDTTQNFTAAEITDGTLLAFVNAIPTLDVASNFTLSGQSYETFTNASNSGFSITNSDTGARGGFGGVTGISGDVLSVSFDLNIISGSPRLILSEYNTTNTRSNAIIYNESGSFTSTFTATGDFNFITFTEGDIPAEWTISNFKITAIQSNGFVKTWYDQSGNSNNATQATAASQPKIVSAGALVADGIDFDGTDDKLATTSAISSTNVAIVSVSKSDVNATGAIFSMLDGFNDGHEVLYLANNVRYALEDSDLDVSSTPTNKNLYFANYDGSTQAISINGTNNTQSVSKTVDTITSVSQIGSRLGANLLNGSIEELIVYTSDQSDKRRAIEESIATANGITLGSFSRDGFVKTWYDQSVTNEAGDTATGNHATQATAAEQPKIVSAGALVTATNSLPAIDFTSSVTRLVRAEFLTGQLNSYFTTYQAEAGDSSQAQVVFRQGTSYRLLHQVETSGKIRTSINDAGSDFVRLNAGGDLATGSPLLQTTLIGARGSDGVTLFVNGANELNGDSTDIEDVDFSAADSGDFFIGSNGTSTDFDFHGKGQEFIFYNSNQSDNRTAIEANIGEAYSIDLPSGVDPGFDQVDGFVETWYDQSGNGRDATQATAGSQPKIVNAGVLLSELDFDGTDDIGLVTGSFSLTQTYSTFSVSHTDEASTSQGVWSKAASANSNFTAVSLFRSDNGFAVNSGATLSTAGTINYVADRTYLQTNVVNGASSSIFVDGATGKTGNAGSTNPSGVLVIGYFRSSGNRFNLDGGIKELIIYDSDQSANRVAIETNINNQYDIY